MYGVLIDATVACWLIFELLLLVRDRYRGKGGTSRDRGTRWLNFLALIAALLIAETLGFVLRQSTEVQFPGWRSSHWHLATGLAVMWAGLALRVWSVTVLGKAFRTTVEVDPGQTIVNRGPYRWVRHPSYTGLLISAVGFGLTVGNWPALAVTLVLPLLAVLRRINLEETTLDDVIGEPYRRYCAHTARLIPYVW